MKPFAERNRVTVGAVGVLMAAGLVVGALQYDKLTFWSDKEYTAYFTQIGGLRTGATVQVSGFRSGRVSSIELEGTQVRVTFDVNRGIQLGDRSEAAIKTKSLLGSKYVEVTTRGDGELDGAIPAERTTAPYELPDALGDLATTISGLNTTQVSDSLATLAETFQSTPPDVQQAVQGLSAFSETIDRRNQELRELLASANKVTGVLGERSEEIAALIRNTNSLLVALQQQSVALDQISGDISAFARQVSGLVAENRTQLRPALDKLNGVLTIVDNRRERIQQTMKLFNQYAMHLGESVASGPFFKAYIVNLLPGQFVQPFIDAAFSDLGLDPNVLAPTERPDPQLGQPGTPALPVPYPRTGQGGEPRMTLPDAITGKPGDPRYPYREPLPAPAPGGPAPGPPATAPPNMASQYEPRQPTVMLAPGEPGAPGPSVPPPPPEAAP
ncbi:MCE family protein [[Mycobacterium] burgundiense]|uniref:MCE family protein n=1 Tax=[Mycobacterium] burgundiense TaxID=3064286 RepID=A0ABM9LHS3_9MYCO|nr:MCE family protein [Mycolicibacterium sp. MU0053]CAJ1499242.1 MCE family protein [Mycolicibacterium sp. MU0053]